MLPNHFPPEKSPLSVPPADVVRQVLRILQQGFPSPRPLFYSLPRHGRLQQLRDRGPPVLREEEREGEPGCWDYGLRDWL